jgi:hypothetical protein
LCVAAYVGSVSSRHETAAGCRVVVRGSADRPARDQENTGEIPSLDADDARQLASYLLASSE